MKTDPKKNNCLVRFICSPFWRTFVKILVLLTIIQAWTLWEQSPSYELDIGKFQRALGDIGACLSLREAQAASPVANAGGDQSLQKTQPLGGNATVIGTDSYDPDGDPLTYFWYGPFPVTSGPTLSVPIPEGRYTLSLMVDDGSSLSAVDETIITVNPCFTIAARAKPGKVQLTWTHLPGTERYEIYRAQESSPSSFVKIGQTTSTYSTYLDETVSNENTYLFVVGAYGQGRWCYSDVVSSRPTASRTLSNYSPVIYSLPITMGTVGIVYNYDVQARDPNLDALTYRLISFPSGMTIDPPSGLISWIPSAIGTFPVTVEVSDGKGGTRTQSFSIVVEDIFEPNRPPVANAGPDQTVYVTQSVELDGSGSTDVDGDLLSFQWSFSSRPPGSAATLSDPTAVKPTFIVDKAGTYVIELIVNDGKVDSTPDSVTISTLNSKPVANAGLGQSAYVGSTVSLNGGASYDVDGDSLAYQWSFASLPGGSAAAFNDPTLANPSFVIDQPGVYFIELVVNDGQLNSNPSNVTITTMNSKPVADAGPDQDVIIGASVILDGSNSKDVDNDPLTCRWSFTTVPLGSGSFFSNRESCGTSFTADLVGLYVAQLIVNDGTVDSDPDTVSINVAPPANRAPMAVNDDYTMDKNTTLTVVSPGVLGNDSDPDGNAITAVLSGNVSNGSLTLNPDGSFAYTPNPGFRGTDGFTYRAYDGSLYSNVVNVTILVVNSPPIITSTPPNLAAEGTPYIYEAKATDPNGDPLTFSLQTAPAGMTIDPATGLILWLPGHGDAGDYNVALRVSDSQDGTDTQAYTLKVRDVNRPPTITSLPVKNVTEGQSYLYEVKASDPDGDTLVFSLDLAPAGMIINPATGIITWTAQFTDTGNQAVRVQVNDGKGGTDVQSFTIVVKDVNRPPQITSTPPIYARQFDTYIYQVIASDPDGDKLSYSLGSAPIWMSIDALSGQIAWLPGSEDIGNHLVSVRVNDGHGGLAIQDYSVTVREIPAPIPGVNSPPMFVLPVGNTITISENQTSTIEVLALDPDGDPVSYSTLIEPVSWPLSFDATTLILTASPDFFAARPEPYVVRFAADDGKGGSAFFDLNIYVGNVNRPPVLEPLTDKTLCEGETLPVPVASTDPDGAPLTLSASNLPSFATFTDQGDGTGSLILAPQTGDAGTYSNISVQVSDSLSTDAKALSVTVNPAATTPPPPVEIREVWLRKGWFVQRAGDFQLPNPQSGDRIDMEIGDFLNIAIKAYDASGNIIPMTVTTKYLDGQLTPEQQLMLDRYWTGDPLAFFWDGYYKEYGLFFSARGDDLYGAEGSLPLGTYAITINTTNGCQQSGFVIKVLVGASSALEVLPSRLRLIDDPVQLTVIRHYPNGSQADVTANANYEVSGLPIFQISASGLVTPLQTGTSGLIVSYDGYDVVVPVAVVRGAKAIKILNVPRPQFEVRPAGLLEAPRQWHTTSRLATGEILVSGGAQPRLQKLEVVGQSALRSAEVFSPLSDTWRRVGDMNVSRYQHQAVPLEDGRVLVAGGRDDSFDTDGSLDSAEIYDPSAASWSLKNPMRTPRSEFAMVRLQDGRVLAAGGVESVDSNGQPTVLSSGEIFDPVSNTWSDAGSMSIPRSLLTLTLLPDGRVLAAGGYSRTGYSAGETSSSELYDPITNSWTVTGNLNVGRNQHEAVLLDTGQVLICGGIGNVPSLGNRSMNICELYDPSTGQWRTAGEMNQERHAHTLTRLLDGRVLATGGRQVIAGGILGLWEGLQSAEVYDPGRNMWFPVPNLLDGRQRHSAVLLDDGKVLIAGGAEGDTKAARITSELYVPLPDLNEFPIIGKPLPGGVFLWQDRLVIGFELTDGSFFKLNESKSGVPFEWGIDFAVSGDGGLSVSKDGLITGAGTSGGSSLVTAAWNGLPDATTVNKLLPPDPPVLARLQVSPEKEILGDLIWTSKNYIVTGKFSDGSTEDLTSSAKGTTYISSDPLVASIGPEGIAEAYGRGSAALYALNENKSAGALVEVAESKLLGMLIKPEKIQLNPGEAQQLEVTLAFSNSPFVLLQDVTARSETTYTSSNPDVAIVSPQGLVSAVSDGIATITVRNTSYPSLPQNRTVEVLVGRPRVTRMVLWAWNIGGQLYLEARLDGYGSLEGIPVDFTVTGPNSFSYAGTAPSALWNGVALADLVAPGLTLAGTYTAVASLVNPDGGIVTANVTFDIGPGVPVSMQLNISATEVLAGESIVAYLSGRDQYDNLIPALSPDSITTNAPGGTVEPLGGDQFRITFPSAGTFEIAARYQAFTASVPVLVDGVDGIAIRPSRTVLSRAGETLQLTMLSFSKAGFNRDVTPYADYSSSDPSVASVDTNGLVTALAGGVAIITAQFEGKTATAMVEVSILPASTVLSGIDLSPFANPMQISFESINGGIQATAQVFGTGDLGGIVVTFQVQGFDNPITKTSVTNASGVASALLKGLYGADSGSITATVSNPAGGASFSDSESLILVPGPLGMISLKLDRDTILPGESIGFVVETKDIFMNLIEGIPVEVTVSDAGATITGTGFEGNIMFPNSGIFDITVKAGDISRVRRVIVRSASDEIVLSDLSPAQGAPGMPVRILGAGFNPNRDENTVLFDGTPAVVTDASPWRLVAIVPEGIGSGPVSITVVGAPGTSLPFIVDPSLMPPEMTDQEEKLGFRKGEVLIAYKSDWPTDAEMAALAADHGIVRQLFLPDLGLTSAILADQTFSGTMAALATLNADNRVRFAGPRFLVRASQVLNAFNDPEFMEQQHLHLTNISLGLQTIFPQQGEGITIGFLDTGLDLDGDQMLIGEFKNPERRVNLVSTRLGRFLWPSLFPDLSDVSDRFGSNGHGTAVAATAAARGDNGFHGVGVAPKAGIVSMRVFYANGYTDPEIIFSGLYELAKSPNVGIINMSLGVSFQPENSEIANRTYTEYADAINKAYEIKGEKRLILVASAGNDRVDSLDAKGNLIWKACITEYSYPAAVPGVIAVGAMEPEVDQPSPYLNLETVADYSSLGSFVDFVAPGTVWTTGLNDGKGVKIYKGTSFAAPIVSGLVALIQAEYISETGGSLLDRREIRKRIKDRFTYDIADPLKAAAYGDKDARERILPGKDEATGYGRIHIYDLFGVTGPSTGTSGTGELVRIDPHGQTQTLVADRNPWLLAVSNKGEIFLAEQASPLGEAWSSTRILKVAPDGKTVTEIVPPGILGSTHSIVLDDIGNIVVLADGDLKTPFAYSSGIGCYGGTFRYVGIFVFDQAGVLLESKDLYNITMEDPPGLGESGLDYDCFEYSFRGMTIDETNRPQNSKTLIGINYWATKISIEENVEYIRLVPGSIGGGLWQLSTSGVLEHLVSGFPDLGMIPLLVNPQKIDIDEGGTVFFTNSSSPLYNPKAPFSVGVYANEISGYLTYVAEIPELWNSWPGELLFAIDGYSNYLFAGRVNRWTPIWNNPAEIKIFNLRSLTDPFKKFTIQKPLLSDIKFLKE